MPEVWIPPLMQRLTGGQKQVHVAGQTIRQVIDNLDQVFPGLKMELYDEEEDLVMPGIAVVVDGRCFASQDTDRRRFSKSAAASTIRGRGGPGSR